MRKTPTFALLALFVGATAFAQESPETRSETRFEDQAGGTLKDEVVGFKPQVGALVFNEATTGDTTSRGAAGIGVDFNVSPLLSNVSDQLQNWYLGVSTGVIASHLGSNTSNFFGTDPDVSVTDPGANMLIIPANLKLGWNIGQNARVSLHGGGNLIYRSVASAVDFGAASFGGGDDWTMYPNAGADLEFGMGRNVSLLLRPDYTFTPGDDLFAGTVGLGISLG